MNEKVTYILDNIASDKLSDAKFAKTVQELLNAFCKLLVKDCKNDMVECGILSDEKGKIVCLVDAKLAMLLPLDALKDILAAGKVIALDAYESIKGVLNE